MVLLPPFALEDDVGRFMLLCFKEVFQAAA